MSFFLKKGADSHLLELLEAKPTCHNKIPITYVVHAYIDFELFYY